MPKLEDYEVLEKMQSIVRDLRVEQKHTDGAALESEQRQALLVAKSELLGRRIKSHEAALKLLKSTYHGEVAVIEPIVTKVWPSPI